jgi:hypothetical protein
MYALMYRPRFHRILLLVLAAPAIVYAAERFYIKKSEIFCDTTGTLCLDGTLSYEPNSRIVSLRTRVQKQTGPGTLQIVLMGTDRQGHAHYSEISIDVRGTHSEIVNQQMRPDVPSVDNWSLSSMTFSPHSD